MAIFEQEVFRGIALSFAVLLPIYFLLYYAAMRIFRAGWYHSIWLAPLMAYPVSVLVTRGALDYFEGLGTSWLAITGPLLLALIINMAILYFLWRRRFLKGRQNWWESGSYSDLILLIPLIGFSSLAATSILALPILVASAAFFARRERRQIELDAG